jgi:hypothetical protein
LNQRPPGYEPDELPGCSTPRYRIHYNKSDRIVKEKEKTLEQDISRILFPPKRGRLFV